MMTMEQEKLFLESDVIVDVTGVAHILSFMDRLDGPWLMCSDTYFESSEFLKPASGFPTCIACIAVDVKTRRAGF